MRVKLLLLLVSLAVVCTASGCATGPGGNAKTPPPNLSNDVIVQRTLAYKACPSQADDLQQVATRVLAESNAQVNGTAIFRRYGDQAMVAIAYQRQGTKGEATFTYTLSSDNLTANNEMGQKILQALSAECRP